MESTVCVCGVLEEGSSIPKDHLEIGPAVKKRRWSGVFETY